MAYQPGPVDQITGVDRPAVLAMLSLGLAVLAYLGVVAWRLPIDYWDGFDYLNNARVLAGHASASLPLTYSDVRPPLVPLVLAPLMAFYAPHGAGAYPLTHLLMWATGVVALWRSVCFFRRSLPLEWSLCAGLVMVSNAAFFSQLPFVMADVASMFGCVLALEAALRFVDRPSWPTACVLGGVVALAILTKYPCGLLLPLVGAAVVLSGSSMRTPRALVQLAVAGLGALSLVYLAHCVIFGLVHHDWSRAWLHALDGVRGAFSAGAQIYASDQRDEYLRAAWVLFSPPLCLAGVAGVLVALRRRAPADLLHLAWGIGFALALSLVIAHKETRYALPVLPSCAYFIVTGLRAGYALLTRWRGGRLPRLLELATALIVA
ncbi:MAG: glycosyltransferase family 39 protein, partial [Archangium sp.]|nr:glycosyltransferase family 39 protein [Archangium sp.]